MHKQEHYYSTFNYSRSFSDEQNQIQQNKLQYNYKHAHTKFS